MYKEPLLRLCFFDPQDSFSTASMSVQSMLAMRHEGITEVLTDDDYFTQEGFAKLL